MTGHDWAFIPDGLRAAPPDGDWEALRPGVEAMWLYRTAGGGPAAAYLCYQPGAHVPRHFHPGIEHVFVISGAQQDENGWYPAGSHVINPIGSRHSVHSPEGCVVLVIWSRQVVFETWQT
ncbi:cupin domain-containing protein [Spiribacter roseus]|uniref:cupin domain-containing protein n=1 Tax=Spiribacter roseus TaxID=1855875 RepID=UPI00133087E9|nr:cupin domain-containing protein [Spiribacter roseus]